MVLSPISAFPLFLTDSTPEENIFATVLLSSISSEPETLAMPMNILANKGPAAPPMEANNVIPILFRASPGFKEPKSSSISRIAFMPLLILIT